MVDDTGIEPVTPTMSSPVFGRTRFSVPLLINDQGPLIGRPIFLCSL
jgi:hypothetical protein